MDKEEEIEFIKLVKEGYLSHRSRLIMNLRTLNELRADKNE